MNCSGRERIASGFFEFTIVGVLYPWGYDGGKK